MTERSETAMARRDDRAYRVFETLVRENERMLLTYLRAQIRDPGIVDDLFQETLITAWRKFDDFDSSRPLGPWLRGIALNLARNAARRRQADPHVFSETMHEAIEPLIDQMGQSGGRPIEQLVETLHHCLQKLPGHSRELIRLRYQENQNATAIAHDRGKSPVAIRKSLQRLRLTLGQCLGKAIPTLRDAL